MIGVGLGVVAKRRYSGFPFALRSFWQRVRDGGGTMFDYNTVLDTYRALQNAGIDMDDIELLWNSDGGAVVREDGILKFYRTGFGIGLDLDGSVTATAQPRLVGGIAPNSKVAASNQNGEARYFTHPAISFAANKAWSISIMFDWNGTDSSFATIVERIANRSEIQIKNNTNRILIFDNSGTQIVANVSTTSLIGKKNVLTIVNNNTVYSIYINGVLITQSASSVGHTFSFSRLFGFYSYSTINGSVSYYRIQSGAMTAAQVLSEATFLRTKYPEIESVVIGTQEWSTRNFEAVATPLGVTIPNVTANADWANATVLYNAAISAGATEREALIAAAMWCYYDNAAANGAIYGKLYNWYAAKLLDLDMESAGFGWRVPTSLQFTALATYLGGASVAGGKMKMTGLDYWNTPNTGATNESGFTALGGGERNDANGLFYSTKTATRLWATNKDSFRLTNDSELGFLQARNANLGISIRLIKE
jgi:uncharacterized protein (TIGR02145 family)